MLNKPHNIPIGSFVQVDCAILHRFHGMKQFVVAHRWDSFGRPLYDLCSNSSGHGKINKDFIENSLIVLC